MDTPKLSLVAKVLSIPSKLILNSLFKKADKIISASLDYIKESDIKNIYNKFPDKFLEIPFGVDTDRFKPLNPLPESGFTILFVGGLDKAHNFKGLPILLKTFSQLPITLPTGQAGNYQLLIVGDGDMRKHYEKQAEDLNIKDKLKFLGNVSNQELPHIYNQADVFALPSLDKSEAFGIVLLEALSSGVPVIASNLPGVRKVFTDKEEGLLVKPNNVNDLKKKIEYLFNNKEVRLKMSLNARNLVTKKYNQTIIKNKYLNIFT